MFEKLYMIIGSIEILILLIFIGKYIYFEKFFKNLGSWYFFLGSFLFCGFWFYFFTKKELVQVILPFLFYSILIFLSRKKNKFKGLFLVLPATGMLCPLIVIPTSFLYLFSESTSKLIDLDTIWLGLLDIIFWIAFVLFLWKGKKRRRRFDEVIHNRTLSKWERNLVNTTGFFLFTFSLFVLNVDEFQVASLYAKCFVGFGIFIVAFLMTSIIAMVIQGNGKNYFQQSAILNEHYLKAQLQHFKTYQETQRETRRVHHDMKNHITCLYNLILDRNYDEASKYILDLNIQIHQIDKEIHTGNDIVDAIVNEKLANAKKEHISIVLDGKIRNLTVDAIDLCTIFSNALDNALEALKSSSASKKEIQILCKQQNTMQFFMFRNPVESENSSFFSSTTKKDYMNHGFGLGNIRMAVDNYKGHMDYYIEVQGEQRFFVLEIILFVHPTT